MSRHIPYPPPGYVQGGSPSDTLLSWTRAGPHAGLRADADDRHGTDAGRRPLHAAAHTRTATRTCRASGRPSTPLRRISRRTRPPGRPAGQGVVEGGVIPYQAGGAREEERELRKARLRSIPKASACFRAFLASLICRARFRSSSRPTRCPSLRVPECDPLHLHERESASRRAHRLVDGRLARPVGGRHARGGRGPFQRPDVVRSGGQLPQRGPARGGALHADEPLPHRSTKPRSRIPKTFTRPWKISMPSIAGRRKMSR